MQEFVNQHIQKLKQSENEYQLIALIVFIKSTVACYLLNSSKGWDIFPGLQSDHSTLILSALEKYVGPTAIDSHVHLLHKHTQVGRQDHYVCTFFQRPSGLLHDTVLLKFSNAFFSSLSPTNSLYYSFQLHFTNKILLAPRIFLIQYTRNMFIRAFGWFIVILQVRRCWLLVRLHVKFCCTYVLSTQTVPTLPNTQSDDVLIYFLAFLVLKNVRFTYLILFIFIFHCEELTNYIQIKLQFNQKALGGGANFKRVINVSGWRNASTSTMGSSFILNIPNWETRFLKNRHLLKASSCVVCWPPRKRPTRKWCLPLFLFLSLTSISLTSLLFHIMPLFSAAIFFKVLPPAKIWYRFSGQEIVHIVAHFTDFAAQIFLPPAFNTNGADISFVAHYYFIYYYFNYCFVLLMRNG